MSAAEKITLFVIGVLMVWFLSQPLFYPDPSFFYFDDFFYYVVPARHFLTSGSFDFYPGMPTNGFQPLWMCVVLSALLLSGQNMFIFFALINSVIGILMLISVYQAMTLLREQNARPSMRIFAGLFIYAMLLQIAATGMEVAAAVPLLLYLTRLLLRAPVSALAPRQLLYVGFIAALTILARLDAVLLLLPVGIWLISRDRPSLKQLGTIALGASPLAVYALLNLYFTRSLLPMSGHAKMLKENLVPTLRPLLSYFEVMGHYSVFFFGAFCVLALAGIFARNHPQRPMLMAAIIGTVLYYATYCVFSDWQVWFWYIYPLGWIATLGMAGIAQYKWKDITAGLMGTLAVMLCLPTTTLIQTRTPESNSIYPYARAVSEFASTHPGIYAMGDCAGVTTYLMTSPVVQLEGLVADSHMLEYIKQRKPLAQLLQDYKADYYVAVDVYEKDGCYNVREPLLSGPASPHMRGTICAKPLMRFVSELPVVIFNAKDVK